MRRTIPLAALVAVTLGLTACGGDPEPAPPSATRPAAPSSATASSSASPAESASGSGGLYVALGDSLAAGYQPGGAELRDTAYPALTATRLGAAAGPDVPVLVLGYYNPWLAAKALNQPVKGVDAAAKAYTALSTAIESAATSSGTTFVGLDQAFSTNDTTPTTINGRSVPKNAAAICTLTNICTAADIHLTDEGAATVARVLAKAAEKAGVS